MATSMFWSAAARRRTSSSRRAPGSRALASSRSTLVCRLGLTPERAARILGRAMRKRRVAVVGATGVAGQQFLASLAGHPWFEVAVLAASARSAGRPYGEAIREASGARRWWVAGTEPAPEFLALPVVDAAHLDPDGLDLVFAAVESDAARELEPAYARAVPVISTAAAFRYETDTPIALPGVNVAAHLPLLAEQRRRRGWKGYVLPLPNCTTVGLAISLKPRGDYAGLGLPSAPAHPILVHDDPFRPQPRLDRDAEGGMATSVGRLRAEPALRNGLKYVALSHNTRMGAAQGAVLTAEHLCHAGVI